MTELEKKERIIRILKEATGLSSEDFYIESDSDGFIPEGYYIFGNEVSKEDFEFLKKELGL